MTDTILVVEDDTSVRETVRDVLEDHGYRVADAANGREALEWLESAAKLPRLVLLDLMMPVMSGLDFLRAVKADVTLRAVPIVLMSAASAEKIDEALRIADDIHVLAKPLALEPLIRAVERSR